VTINLDEAFVCAKRLCEELKPRLAEIETEQDARFQMINRFLVEALGWEFSDIKTEPHNASGYTDYLLSTNSQKQFVIEAKRNGALLLNTLNQEMNIYKVGGPALKSAGEGIKQAATYCLEYGVNYAALTTGNVWIGFIPFPGSGTSYREGSAYVFPNFDSILNNFAVFFDLFSKDGVRNKTYNLQFAKASGLSIGTVEPLISANKDEDLKMLPPSELAADLDPIFREFFGALSSDTDREMLIECFVETRESQFADASLEKMVRSVSASICELAPASTADNQLAKQIQTAVDTGLGETIVLVGNNGAGKSTFVERFFDSILERSIRDRCLVIRVDLLKSTGDMESIKNWLTHEIKLQLEGLLFLEGNPTFDQLQGLYWKEYHRWMTGQHKPLYDTDKTAFKIKFGEFLSEEITNSPLNYILRLLDDAIKNRKLLPCLIFDNTDHFDLSFQESIFQYSQGIHQSVPFTFIVMPITDRSLWRLSKAGPFQTYRSKMFYLPVPPTKSVLEKRVSYLKRKIEENKSQHHYFLKKGIRLSLDNLNAFAACLEEVFIKEDFVARRISWLTNNNLRKSLELTQKIITSPFFTIEDLVTAFIAHGANAPLKMNYHKFMKALMLGNYNIFQQEQNLYIFNIFSVSPYFPTTPLLALSVLKLLIEKAGEGQIVDGYIMIDQAKNYFLAMSVTESAIENLISTLLSRRLIEPYDASDDSLSTSQRIGITHAGRMHYEMAITDQFFITDIAYATPMRGNATVDKLRALKNQKMGSTEWEEVQKVFLIYCLEQDNFFVRLPKDSLYDGQRQLRIELSKRWVEPKKQDSHREINQPAEGFSHIPVVVKWFNADKGYGFVEAGLNQDVFIHRNVLEQAELQTIQQGTSLMCDVAKGAEGKFQVIAVHSTGISDHLNTESALPPHEVEGIVDFYNPKKGFGFIKVPALPEDVYISARVLEREGVKELISNMKVKLNIEQGRRGKGLMASSLKIIE
jgi:cold shock CspA family protein